MAKLLMASSSTKSLLPTQTLTTPKPKLPNKTPLLTLTLPKIQQVHKTLTQTLTPKSLSTTLLTSLLLPLPSLAEEIEKASLFDFNLTLPIIAAEFLFLMFALDKIYYTPLGNFMDQRDASIKGKLAEMKDTSTEVKDIEEQSTAVMRAARAEISAALNKMKKETQAEVEAKLAEGRQKVEAELQEALGILEKQKAETIKALDSQITALSEDIVKKVLPVSS